MKCEREGCDEAVPPHAGVGRPRRFCSDRCKNRVYYEARRARGIDYSGTSHKTQCAGACGGLVWLGKGSLPPGRAMCRDCRKAETLKARRRECIRCGAEFYAANTTSDRLYCGIRCSAPAALEKARAAHPPRQMSDCEVCGEQFPATTNHGLVQRTCSRECGKQVNARNVRFARGKFTEWRSILPTCGRCGAVAYRGKLARYCRECVDAVMRENWAKDKRRLNRAERVAVQCGACGVDLIQVGKIQRRWCADCAKRHNRHRRRARDYGVEYEPINPMEIYERDKWICHICTEEIHKVPGNEIDIDGWSLDHVIPMVHGGPHLKWNVAASHWMCNTFKADQFFVEAS